ncbi:MAG: acyltransferase [Bacteroidales bacterium]|jgi:phenylacetate-coenzyme A ligase PaaK-like adenylate-forming protein|nr:acyltransferase [Bacteroidales bacterium]
MNLEDIFHPFSEIDFEKHALALFQYQYENNEVYRSFCNLLKINALKITSVEQIPFLPISFFKTHIVKTGSFEPEIEFWSSGTTMQKGERRKEFLYIEPSLNKSTLSSSAVSRHLVKDVELYECSFLKSFEYFYGNPKDYCFLTLLPNYLEQKHSSLIYMMKRLISLSKYAESGFYLNNFEELYRQILLLKEKSIKTILFGVSFALLDFAEQFTFSVPELTVFETGGMKGRRVEIVKEELHQILCNAFGINTIHSEYGMCELLSQAYSSGNNLFTTPPWMKILLRDERDPLHCSNTLNSGAINIIDFANLHSCAFIATDDLGKKSENSMIEILGRLDVSQIRGCNLMVGEF